MPKYKYNIVLHNFCLFTSTSLPTITPFYFGFNQIHTLNLFYNLIILLYQLKLQKIYKSFSFHIECNGFLNLSIVGDIVGDMSITGLDTPDPEVGRTLKFVRVDPDSSEKLLLEYLICHIKNLTQRK